MIKRVIVSTYTAARRIVIAALGGSIVLVGIVMLVTPGPALIVIPAGLAVLSLEFAFARHWLRKVRERISREGQRIRTRNSEKFRQHQ